MLFYTLPVYTLPDFTHYPFVYEYVALLFLCLLDASKMPARYFLYSIYIPLL